MRASIAKMATAANCHANPPRASGSAVKAVLIKTTSNTLATPAHRQASDARISAARDCRIKWVIKPDS